MMRQVNDRLTGGKLRRLWVEAPLRVGVIIGLSREASHYLRRVLRLEIDDGVELFDGTGLVAAARICAVARGHVSLQVSSLRAETEPGCRVTIAMATPKGDRADWAVEKLTEIGVQRIVWLHCARSVVVPASRRSGAESRWRRIAAAAATQSGRIHIPRLEGPIAFENFLHDDADTPPGLRFIADAQTARDPSSQSRQVPGAPILRTPPPQATVIIGPEGGLEDAELFNAQAAGYNRLCLGAFVLRVETAAVVAAALLRQTTPACFGT